MKRNENNKSNRNRSLVVLLVLCAMFASVVAGCNKPVAENPAPEPSTSEVISEVVSEEPSEEVSEEIAEEVEVVNCTGMTDFENYLKELDRTTIVEYNFGVEGSSQTIIPNGSNYTMQLGNVLGVRSNKEVLEIVANTDGFDVHPPMKADIWKIMINTTGTDIEVSCTIKYADGTEEDVTVYVTIE